MELGEAAVWDKPEYAQALGKERSALEAVVKTIDGLEGSLGDIEDLLALASEENDTELFEEAKSDLARV
jgi:peptide chain release factor 2